MKNAARRANALDFIERNAFGKIKVLYPFYLIIY